MIDINELLNNIGVVKSPVSGLETYTKDSVKKLLKEYTELLLKEAADKAQVEEDYWDPFLKPRIIVDKESITSIINDINFD